MAVEIGIRIKSDNITGQDFDRLIGDLKRTGATTQEVNRASENLKREFNALGNKIQEASKVTLDANGRWKDAEGNILNTQQASKRLESVLAEVSDEQLRQIRVFRDAEGRLQDVRSGYISNAEASRRFAQGIERTSREFAEADREARKFSNTLTRHRTELRNVALASAAFTGANALLGRSLVTAAIEMEGIRNGLTALEGSAEAAETRIESLREVIRQPGVGYEDAVKASVQLKAVNLEADLANRTIREFGNSLALVGRTDLNETLLGVRQILSRGRVSQEELNQITERSSLISKVLRDQFGTVLSEDIQAQINQAGLSITEGFLIPVIQGLERLNRAPVDSALNSIQNLQNSAFELRAGLGEVLLPTVTSVVQGITEGVNAFNAMDDGVKSAVVTVGAVTAGLGALTTVLAGTGFALGAFNAYLVTTTGASGLAGFAALVAPSAPLLTGLGILAAGLAPVSLALIEISRATKEARENSREFASQLRSTAAVLENTSAIDSQIKSLREYIQEQRTANEERTRQIENPGLVGSFFLGGVRAAVRERANAADRIRQSERLLELLNQLNSNRRLTIDQLREMDRIIGSNLREARLDEDTEAVKSLESAAQSVVSEFQRFGTVVTRTTRESGNLVRNFAYELVGLNAALSESEDAFSNVANADDLNTATQRRLRALDAVTQVSREQIEAQIAVEGAAISRLDNQERAESEHAEKLRELATQLRQLEVDYEREKTRITREEIEKRTEFYERATELRIEAARRTAEVEAQLNRNTSRDLQLLVSAVSEYGSSQRQRFVDIVNIYRDHGRSTKAAIEGAQDFITLTEGMSTALERTGTATIAFSAILRQNLYGGLRSGIGYFQDFTRSVREAHLATLESEIALTETIARLEDGQAARDQRTQDIFAAGAARFRENEQGFISQGRAFVSELRRQQPFSLDVLSEGAGDLVAAVPVDAIDAITQSVQLRRDANSEILQLEQETASEIQSIQDSAILAAEEKAREIERIERESATQRIRVENQVSERQRESFQSVVTNFISGIGQMIAAEAQLALARRATNAISNLFGGGAAGVASTGGVGLLSGVLAPLLIGGAIAYGASSLIGQSSPSSDVYERSQIGAVSTPGEGGVFRGAQRQGETRASQESGTPTLEANLNVTVEASGTRLGQANERVRVKTERWGG